MNYDFKVFDGKIAGAREWLAKEYGGLRTGRATPAILDGVMVSAYGSMTPIKQVANIGIEDARTLRVSAWDASIVKDIERAISAANLGIGTTADSSGLRVTFPELTAERREQLVKIAKHKLEEARTAVRVARDEAWKEIQAKEHEGTLTEDDKFALKEALQKKVDAANGELEKAFAKKEAEMVTASAEIPEVEQEILTPLVIAGGGRYDYLARALGSKKDVPSVGSSIGMDRIILSPNHKKLSPRILKKPKVYFIQLGFEAKLKSLSIIEILRKARIPTMQALSKDSITAQLGTAEHLAIPYVIIFGQKEALEGSVLVREMEKRSQESVKIEELAEYLKKIK